jgi:hypothetical protein
MPNAYFERELIFAVHSTQLFHKLDHVAQGFLWQASHAHEFPAADFSEAGNSTGRNPVKIAHDYPSVCSGPPVTSERLGGWPSWHGRRRPGEDAEEGRMACPRVPKS